MSWFHTVFLNNQNLMAAVVSEAPRAQSRDKPKFTHFTELSGEKVKKIMELFQPRLLQLAEISTQIHVAGYLDYKNLWYI